MLQVKPSGVEGIFVRELSAYDFFEMEQMREDFGERKGAFMGAWFAAALCDENGNKLFSDIPSASKAIPGRKMQEVYQIAVELSGFGDGPEKNSEGPAIADS